MIRRVALLGCFIGVVGFVGCGDDDDSTGSGGAGSGGGGTGGSSHGVPGDKALSGVSQAEVDKICKDLEKRVAPLVDAYAGVEEYICIASGLAYAVQTGGDVQTCEQGKKTCLDMLAGSGEDAGVGTEPGVVDCPTAEQFAGCEATVDEIDACFTASLKLADDLLKALKSYSCADVSEIVDAGALMDPVTGMEQPPECKKIEQKCPGIFEDQSDASSE